VKFPRLLAKKPRDPEKPAAAETLRGHTALVLCSAELLLQERGKQSLQAAGLAHISLTRLTKIVRLGAFLHDLGKASEHFQGMLAGTRKEQQLVRHEALSLYLCWKEGQLREWLRCAVDTEEDYKLAVIAAAGHHRKFTERTMAQEGAGAGESLKILTSHSDFQSVLRLGATELQLEDIPRFDEDEKVLHTRRESIKDQFDAWSNEFYDQCFRSLDSESKRLLAITKALIIASDVAGSALVPGGEKPSWITQQLGKRSGQKALEEVVSERLNGNPKRPFQQTVEQSSSIVTLVRAGCGTGKTVAAYAWAARQHPHRQLWVTYPTTGTATEGFRDYVFYEDIALEARLDHSRRETDYEIFGLYDGEDDSERKKDRLDSIRSWGCDVIVCTVDTVLGIVQNNRKGLYAWPGLSEGAVVFDEIHAYDEALWKALLCFLENLPGIPCLLMTASLPKKRLEQLRSLTERVHQQQLCEIDGPKELEELERYQIVQASEQEAREQVRKMLKNGGKVLWVSNTVDRCIASGTDWESEIHPLFYHSRFRYIDRVERHKDVIQAFREKDRPAFACTTQVAEMSLDLSADLLVMDLAPIPAMIQRLGRLNRRSTPEHPQPIKTCLVLPFQGNPYEDHLLEEAQQWIEHLEKKNLNQVSLIAGWDQCHIKREEKETLFSSAWIDGGFQTNPSVLREGGVGITVLLPNDAKLVKQKQIRTEKVVLPMNPPPKWMNWQQWKKVNFLPVVENEQWLNYEKMKGGQWQKDKLQPQKKK